MVLASSIMGLNGKDENARKRIAVIGAGMTGLCTLRHFSVDSRYDIVAFERSDTVAGIWNYPKGCEDKSDDTGLEPHYCRIYRGLRLNSPRCLTGYPDYPFPKGTDTYCSREIALEYFQDYAHHFGLLELIKFRHQVVKVDPMKKTDGTVHKWALEAKQLDTGNLIADEFDYVIVCNGHFHRPYIPLMAGIETFRGSVIHSGQYRHPGIYKNKNVLIVGGRASANDLVSELIPTAKQIFVCRRIKSSVFKDFPNVSEVTDIGKFGPNYVTFKEGYTHPIDAVIFCTGFLFDFPFLSEDCGVRVTRGKVSPVYRHIMHCAHPSLAFIGLANRSLICLVSDYQVRFYKAFLDGKIQLPPVEERLAQTEKEHAERTARGIPEHNAHVMTLSQWAYIDQLSKEAGLQSYEPIAKAIYETSIQDIRDSPHGFRNYRIEKIDSENFLHIPVDPIKTSEDIMGTTPSSGIDRFGGGIVNASAYRKKSQFHIPAELRG